MLRRRRVRPRPGQDRHRRHQRPGARRRQTSLGLEGAGQGQPSSPRSVPWLKVRCAQAYQIRSSRRARRPAARRNVSHPALVRKGRRVRCGQVEACFRHRGASCAARSWPGEPLASAAGHAAPVRRSEIRNSVLPRTHGSALFTRGGRSRRWWRRSAPSATRACHPTRSPSSATASCSTNNCRRSHRRSGPFRQTQ